MRNRFFNSFLLVLSIAGACKRPAAEHATHDLNVDSGVIAATGMKSDVPPIEPDSGKRIFSVSLNGVVRYDPRRSVSVSSRVSGRIEKLYVKHNYQRVTKGMLIMEIYSPDLASAQRELIFLHSSGDEQMVQKARHRLELLGMSRGDVERVLSTRNVMYKIPVYSNADGIIVDNVTAEANLQTSDSRALQVREGQYTSAGAPLFSVYEDGQLVADFAVGKDILSQIEKGQKILFFPGNDKSKMQSGTIDLIEPAIRNGQSFALVRVYIKDTRLKAGELVTGNIAVTSSETFIKSSDKKIIYEG